MGWITQDTQSHQLKLNRHGAYFVINLEWNFERHATTAPADLRKEIPGGEIHRGDIVNRNKARLNLAPPPPQDTPVFAPLKKDQQTSNEDQHQETRPAEPSAGAFQEGEGTTSAHPPRPTLKNIRADDLTRLSRLEDLHRQAVTAGWIPASEAMALNFVAASVRAREVGHDAVRVFVTLVRQGLWHHITQAQEDHARQGLAHYREHKPECFRSTAGVNPRGQGVSTFNSSILADAYS
ncbi:MAG: hypothetical protein L0Z50_23960 [Verrucomicrobiales bacterium]|nr:hypothetical protein [Verrucomicrobiales bacterium]